MKDLIKLLRKNGYTVSEGVKDTMFLMKAVSGDDETPRCSGFRVFPDGVKCNGCPDCTKGMKNENNTEV